MANLSRKEKKVLANRKRGRYMVMIADEAGRLTKPVPFNEHWVLALDIFVKDLIATNHLDAHLIRSAAYEFGRGFMKALRSE